MSDGVFLVTLFQQQDQSAAESSHLSHRRVHWLRQFHQIQRCKSNRTRLVVVLRLNCLLWSKADYLFFDRWEVEQCEILYGSAWKRPPLMVRLWQFLQAPA